MPRAAAYACVLATLWAGTVAAAGLVPVASVAWDEASVRRVLHVFAYGGAASDGQIAIWADMEPGAAIQEILSFAPTNPKLSPPQDVTAAYADSLETLQTLLSSDGPDNQTCPEDRVDFKQTRDEDGVVVLDNQGLQHTWIAAVRTRGLNPFRHNVGFWLTNYQMAVNVRDTEAPLARDHYDTSMAALAVGAPLHEVLALGATSAAVAREYSHRNNTYDNATGVFEGNDDFAREFHQLFFLINGDLEDPVYHEEVTIEHTARILTGMQVEKVPGAYGTTDDSDWWVAPIDFSDYVDGTGRDIPNATRHHAGDLEVLGTTISGATAEEKLFDLAEVAIHHPESLDNVPVRIVGYFADDNLDAEKTSAIREAWRDVVGTPNDLLHFLRDYAVSRAFHAASTYKYRNAFHRNMTIHNLNTVDNPEVYGNTFSPRLPMLWQGADVFFPVRDVFGGQTSLDSANSPGLFAIAYNRAVDFSYDVTRTADPCRDTNGTELFTWNKDWARAIPPFQSGYTAGAIGRWLWKRFIGDDGHNYGEVERAHVTSLLATGLDLGYVVDPTSPENVYSADDLASEPLRSVVEANRATTLDLASFDFETREEANRRIGLAINFIAATPSMFVAAGGEPPLCGDNNGDGRLNAGDAARISIWTTAGCGGYDVNDLASVPQTCWDVMPRAWDPRGCDVNGNGFCDITDKALLNAWLAAGGASGCPSAQVLFGDE